MNCIFLTFFQYFEFCHYIHFHREACCGTHVKNTCDISEISITSLTSLGPGMKSITAVTGTHAHQALLRGQQLLADTVQLRNEVEHIVAEKAADQVCKFYYNFLCMCILNKFAFLSFIIKKKLKQKN